MRAHLQQLYNDFGPILFPVFLLTYAIIGMVVMPFWLLGQGLARLLGLDTED